MPAAIPIAIAIATTTATAVMSNQATQHAKGAAEAQAKQAADAATAQGAIGPGQNPNNPNTATATIAAQDAARRKAALQAGMVSTIGTGNFSTPGAPAAKPPQAYGAGNKTTLG